MNDLFICLGSNINKEVNLPAAVQFLAELGLLTAVAPVYETIPVGMNGQPNFFNTAVRCATPLTIQQAKIEIVGSLEKHLHRVRTADKNAPRTIDADIVLFNDAVLDYEMGDGRSRHIPDPDILKFAHVAIPLADIAPAMRHPETGEPLASIAARLHAAAPDMMWPRPDISLLAK